jgi:hypothetical protein
MSKVFSAHAVSVDGHISGRTPDGDEEFGRGLGDAPMLFDWYTDGDTPSQVFGGFKLSDKTARSEFGLAQDEIIAAIRAGKLQYRQAAMHGNPWLRLLRREVEDLVSTRHGERYLREQQARTELKRVNRELKQLRTQLTALEERRAALLSELAGQG